LIPNLVKSGRRAIAVLLAATALAGCAYDYMQRTDRVAYSAGDAVKTNMAIQTTNPSKGSMYDTRGLGKNGPVLLPPQGGTAAGQ